MERVTYTRIHIIGNLGIRLNSLGGQTVLSIWYNNIYSVKYLDRTPLIQCLLDRIIPLIENKYKSNYTEYKIKEKREELRSNYMILESEFEEEVEEDEEVEVSRNDSI